MSPEGEYTVRESGLSLTPVSFFKPDVHQKVDDDTVGSVVKTSRRSLSINLPIR